MKRHTTFHNATYHLYNERNFKMKRKIAMLTALLALTMTFAACGNNGSDAADTSAPEASVSESETSAEETSDTEEDILPDESESIEGADEAVPDDGLIDDAFGVDHDAGDPDGEAPAADEETSENPLYPAVEKAISESEWPTMSEITDEVILKEFFLLNPANYDEFIVMQCPISAIMSEIIIIKSDDVASAEADLEARQKKAIDTDAWYPEDQELAASSIVGTNGDYAYFIIGTNASDAEKSINDYISSLS